MAVCVTASKTDKTTKEDLIEAGRANFMADCVTASKTYKTAKDLIEADLKSKFYGRLCNCLKDR